MVSRVRVTVTVTNLTTGDCPSTSAKVDLEHEAPLPEGFPRMMADEITSMVGRVAKKNGLRVKE